MAEVGIVDSGWGGEGWGVTDVWRDEPSPNVVITTWLRYVVEW